MWLKKLNVVVNYASSAGLTEFSSRFLCACRGDSEVAVAMKIGRFRWKIMLIDSVIG
jgi:hypothetical protein